MSMMELILVAAGIGAIAYAAYRFGHRQGASPPVDRTTPSGQAPKPQVPTKPSIPPPIAVGSKVPPPRSIKGATIDLRDAQDASTPIEQPPGSVSRGVKPAWVGSKRPNGGQASDLAQPAATKADALPTASTPEMTPVDPPAAPHSDASLPTEVPSEPTRAPASAPPPRPRASPPPAMATRPKVDPGSKT